METQAGRRRGEPSRRGGAGGRRGRPRLGDPAAGDPPGGAPLNGGRGGGARGGRGGKQSGNAEQRALPVGSATVEESTGGGGGEVQGTPPPHPRDSKEGNASNGDTESRNLGGPYAHPGQHAGDTDQESLNLGGPYAHPGQHADETDQESPNLGDPYGHPGKHADEVAAGFPQPDDEAQSREEAKTADDAECSGGAIGTAKQLPFHLMEEADKKSMAKAKGKARAAPIRAPSTLLPQRTFLSDALLSWTVKEVMDEHLYKDKVSITTLSDSLSTKVKRAF